MCTDLSEDGVVERSGVCTDLREDGVVELSAERHVGHPADEQGGVGAERGLSVQIGGQTVPVLEADLEDLGLVHLRDHDEVVQRLHEDLVQLRLLLDQLAVLLEEAAQEETQVLNEVLLVIAPVFVCVLKTNETTQESA